ncbi:MAG: hypothetical protein IPG99_16495 [Ignavibacteria bacterium]|nr:hypothetical protein [Ignavibacteria bacterium]
MKRYLEPDESTNSLGNSLYGMEYGTDIHLATYRHAMGSRFKSKIKG